MTPCVIPLTEPELGSEEIEAVTKVLASKWLTMGEVTAAFEREFAAMTGVKHAIAVANCTAALHLAYVALGIGPGDEVICPSLTFVATANAARATGAAVRFAGVVSEEDLTVSPADIARQITSKTKAIAVVHYAGFPCLMDEILEIAHGRGIAVVEDCAHAPLAWSAGPSGNKRYAGSMGDVGCFSFFGNKNITTGEGGMITTNRDDIADLARLLRSHGMTSTTYDRHKGHSSSYDVVAPGYNYRIDEIRSAIGICQLRKLDHINMLRRGVIRWYREILGRSRAVRIPFLSRDLETSAAHLMVVLVKGADAARDYLRDRGIQTSKHYTPVSQLSLYANAAPDHMEVADDLITLPLSSRMTREQVEVVAGALTEFCDGRNGAAVISHETISI